MNDGELLWHVRTHTIPAALALLPGRMDAPAARAMLLAIGLQESGFAHRRQVGGGSARGLWQFEKGGGVAEILTDTITAPYIASVCRLCLVAPTPAACYGAIEYHDVLAACFARLLLYRDPDAMPTSPTLAWQIYLRRWRPGKPRPQTWPGYFAEAWRVVAAVD